MIEHKNRAEAAIDHLTAARAHAQDAGDRRAAEQYTKAIQQIARITDCVATPDQIAEQYTDTPGIAHVATSPDGNATIDTRDGSRITATVTGGHGHMHTLDGRRLEWTITGNAAARYGALAHDDNSHRDQDLADAIRRAAADAA